MQRVLTRRDVLKNAGAAGGALALSSALPRYAAAKTKVPLLGEGTFACGVASGFPGTNDITLWTRLDSVARNGRVTLEVAKDPGFANVVRSQDVNVKAIRNFTARARLTGLDPGEELYYRFDTGKASSPVGRFRTLRPVDSAEPIRVGYFSCQDYQAGYYPAHAALAKEDDLDLVICLGDYIYEATYYPGPADRKDTIGANHDATAITIDDYRAKYRLYKSDPDLQAMHAAHPYVSIWDDHEVEDNYDSSQRDPAKPPYPNFAERQRVAYLAFFEYMPRVRTRPVSTQIYGSVKLGKQAELFLTDERQYRDVQPCNDAFLTPCADVNTPGRTLLGAQQKAWFKDAVPKSQATWKLVANELMIMGFDAVPGQSANVDAWDGYGAERTEILQSFVDAGVKDLSFLTGDIHTFFAGQVTTTGRRGGTPIATEFVGGSITSLGLDSIASDPVSLAALQTGLLTANPHFSYADLKHRGYTVMTAAEDGLTVEYKAPASALVRDSPVSTLQTFKVERGSPSVEKV